MMSHITSNVSPAGVAVGDIYPPDAPGMPPPGPDIMAMARARGEEVVVEGKTAKTLKLVNCGPQLHDIYKQLTYSHGNKGLRITIKAERKSGHLRVISGHLWGAVDATGPVPADVMVVSKMLGEEEVAAQLHFIGASGTLLREFCEKYAGTQVNGWYVTNILKTGHPLGPGNSKLRKSWIKEWLPVLHQELRIVRPKILLLLGADASKAVLGDQASITWMEGRVIEHTIPIGLDVTDTRTHTCLAMAVTHPAAVISAPELEDKFENGIARFVQLVKGQRWDREEAGLDHRYVATIEELRDLTAEINADVEENLLGVDAEWHGQHPNNAGSYLRSFQVSWRYKTSAYIAFRDSDGNQVYKDDDEVEAKELIVEICRGKQLAGHFFDADMEFLTANGIDLREMFRVPDAWEAYMDACLANKPCGFDTGLAAHALNETDDFGLTYQSLRNTTAPRYDQELVDWKKAYCSKNNLKQEELEGYGPCPDSILVPYGNYDSDVTRRLAVKRKQQLVADHLGNCCWEPMWMSMRALPVVLEINCTGVRIDRERVDKLTLTYMVARDKLEKKIRDWARWPGFNLNSVFHVREFLFGEDRNGHDKVEGKSRRLRPLRGRPQATKVNGKKGEYIPTTSARSLKLRPIMTTDKRPMLWDEVLKKGLLDEKTASTNKTALAILAQDSQEVVKMLPGGSQTFDFSPQITWLRDHRFSSQVLKSVLRPPVLDKDEDTGVEYWRTDQEGHLVFAGGLAANICDDGRVRTHIYPTKETRRWASARPPLHNLGKRREKDYKRILAEDYCYPLRTIICADDDMVLVEADYIGAELFVMAVMSGDAQMIDHAQRNQLAEDNPDFYDIHSHVAVMAFGLKCPPTKAGLASIEMAHLRIIAKSVVFGIAYGRGAKAIALAAKEEGVNITVRQAQQVIDTILGMYPGLTELFQECCARVAQERWLCGPYGGLRRFPRARDPATLGDFERQAKNFPIQGMIADVVSRACDHLDEYRRSLAADDPFRFNIVLQIHDALLFEVANQHVARLIDEVLPLYMVQKVPIYPAYLDGMPKNDPKAPYFLGLDTEVASHWGEMLYPEEFAQRGISPNYGGWTQAEQGWSHVHKNAGEKVWRNGAWHKIIA